MPAPKTNLPISDLADPNYSMTRERPFIPDVGRARRIRHITGLIALVLSLMPIALILFFHYLGNAHGHASAEPYRLFSMFLRQP
jgi:hypothetical protein